jgi:hypothetical protein
MSELLEKDKKFEWTSACETSFLELKKRLTTAPILVMPDMEKPFSIYCDASLSRIGMCTHARWSRGSICFMTVEKA